MLQYLFNEINAGLQIHAKVDESPSNSFSGVLLLLEDKHVMVEELLQLLVGKVDAQLLETVKLQNKGFKVRLTKKSSFKRWHL